MTRSILQFGMLAVYGGPDKKVHLFEFISQRSMSHGNGLTFINGVISRVADTSPVTTLLQAHPGAYTTTRTQNSGSEILFWERHLQRLSNSFKFLLKHNPNYLFEKPENNKVPFMELSTQAIKWDSVIPRFVNDSMGKALPLVLKERKCGEELAITALVSGNSEKLGCLEGDFDEEKIHEVLDVYLHVNGYVSPVFDDRAIGVCLAVVGRGREFANAKYSDWVRLRKPLEKLRPPFVTELLLSNDGDQILEGCLTNFFVICQKGKGEASDAAKQNGFPAFSFVEVQTAPLSDGVLPGVIRQVIREICLKIGIPFREVAPSWSQRELWTEAFITNSLRLLQHVEAIQVPNSWKSVESETWEEITWMEKRFEDVPGSITSIFQREILEKAGIEGFPIASFEDRRLLF